MILTNSAPNRKLMVKDNMLNEEIRVKKLGLIVTHKHSKTLVT